MSFCWWCDVALGLCRWLSFYVVLFLECRAYGVANGVLSCRNCSLLLCGVV